MFAIFRRRLPTLQSAMELSRLNDTHVVAKRSVNNACGAYDKKVEKLLLLSFFGNRKAVDYNFTRFSLARIIRFVFVNKSSFMIRLKLHLRVAKCHVENIFFGRHLFTHSWLSHDFCPYTLKHKLQFTKYSDKKSIETRNVLLNLATLERWELAIFTFLIKQTWTETTTYRLDVSLLLNLWNATEFDFRFVLNFIVLKRRKYNFKLIHMWAEI